MLITCPKCGFSQPQDRYCAKCGIDIENYKPISPPIFKQIVSNPFLHIFLIFLAVAIVIIFVRKHSQLEMANRVQFLKGGPTVVSRKTTGTNKNSNAPPAPPLPASSSNNSLSVASAERPDPTTDDNKKTINENVGVKIIFAEVDHQTMEILRQESRSTGQFTEFGDFKAGALPNIKKSLHEKGVRSLHRIEDKFDKDGNNISASVGASLGDGNFLGLTYAITLHRVDPNTISGEIEMLQNFHETSDLSEAPVKRTYPSTTFELSAGQGWMITLNLPTVPQEDSDNASSNGIMRIFQSPQYKSKQTEFTLFFEFDKPASN